MATKTDLIDDLNASSEQLSTQVRTIGIAILALLWGGLIGESEVLIKLFSNSPKRMLWTGGFAFLALVLDFLQYVVAYSHSRSQLRKLERSGAEDIKFKYRCLAQRLRNGLFWGKQVLIVTSVLLLMAMLLRVL